MSFPKPLLPRVIRTIAPLATLALASCGGGGDSAPAAPPAVANLVITGTAATGAAIAGAAVDAKCATGSGASTTAADGTYTITISGGVLPCAVRVTAGATVLHSLAVGSGLAARANLTPVTDLAVARLSAGTPAAYYAGFGTAAAGTLTDAAAQAAATAVVTTLKTNGVDFSTTANVLNGALAASHGAVTGDAYDQKLDTLKARMTASGVTQDALAQAVALGAPAAAVASRSAVASLPPELLLAPAASNCAALRSGKYRVVANDDGGTVFPTGMITIDAAALTFVNATGDLEHLTEVANCNYSNSDGGEFMVNKAGIGLTRGEGTGGVLHGALVFPEQSHAVSELAGDYNALAFERTTAGGPVHLTSSSFTIDGNGKLTALNFCDDLRTCVAATAGTLPNLTFSVNAGGGFDVTNTTDNYVDRAYAYRAGGGELMIVILAKSGEMTLATRNVASTLPAVGRIQLFWNLFMNSDFTAPAAINLSRNTVTTVDAAAGSFTRAAVQNFTTNATRPETVVINSLRSGYSHRLAANGVLHSDGSSSNVVEFISFGMRGMDLSVLALPAANQFGLSLLVSSSTP